MPVLQLLSLALGLLSLSPLVSAGLFPSSSHVKMLDPKGFRQAMEANQTSMVAFVAPWCGHCQRMSPEYAKAAQGLHPLVPVYAVDCDDEKNKRLCSEQGVQGFPTVKLFPRGNEAPPMTYSSGERTASAFFDWASRRVPHKISRLKQASEIPPWTEKNVDKPRALLLTKDTKMPLLWKVLGNKYRKVIEFGTHRDIDGETSVAMGYEAGSEKQAKVLLYPVGSTKPARYTGKNKLDSLSAFFDSVLDGTADLQIEKAKAAVPADESEPDVPAEPVAHHVVSSTPSEPVVASEESENPDQVVFHTPVTDEAPAPEEFSSTAHEEL